MSAGRRSRVRRQRDPLPETAYRGAGHAVIAHAHGRVLGRIHQLATQAVGRVNDALAIEGADALFADDQQLRYELLRARGAMLRAIVAPEIRVAELRDAQQALFLNRPSVEGYSERVALAMQQHALELVWADDPSSAPGSALVARDRRIDDIGRAIPGSPAAKLAALQDLNPEAFTALAGLIEIAVDHAAARRR